MLGHGVLDTCIGFYVWASHLAICASMLLVYRIEVM